MTCYVAIYNKDSLVQKSVRICRFSQSVSKSAEKNFDEILICMVTER